MDRLQHLLVLGGVNAVGLVWWKHGSLRTIADLVRNMFLASAPYFQYRFEASPWIENNFQSSILVVSTLFSMSSMILLTRAQKSASYPRRTWIALMINLVTNLLLTISSVTFKTTVGGYFGFMLVMVAMSGVATSLQQNALFSIASGLGREEYVQGLMAGQGVAGVAPCIVQIISVLSVSQDEGEGDGTERAARSAFTFFLTAVGVALVAMLALSYLMQRHQQLLSIKAPIEAHGEDDSEPGLKNHSVSLQVLGRKLKYYASALFLCFGLTMVFPVFAQEIYSNVPENEAPRLLQRASFIPLALLLWNTGDVIGRSTALIPRLRLTYAPKLALAVAVGRFGFLPLFFLCNIKGRGAVVESDFFYLVVVQFLFGLTNGWLGSACMMAAPHWVEDSEKAVTGGFMSLVLVSGLTVGGLCSFLVS